ncbi:hypothetical protein [Pseudoalteromonas rhizosphaerae]|uniref:hypothetical protein n=1 Tax=Pseudoalteromonas rhizosphaerae TaxID=2518973 RepID=UPI0038516447
MPDLKEDDFSLGTLINNEGFKFKEEDLRSHLNQNFSELTNKFDVFHLEYSKTEDANIALYVKDHEAGVHILFELNLWANYFTYQEFENEFVKTLNSSTYQVELSHENEIKIDLDIADLMHKNLLQEIDTLIGFVKDCSKQVHAKLTEESKGNIIKKVFDFPHEYVVTCSQYIIWFGEFLNNLGIDANVSTNQTGSQTQVIISPNDCPELLTEIEKLFYQYLSLPYAELLPPEPNSSQSEMLSFQSLKMQVQHLQTQIQMKDAVISSYQVTNKNLRVQNSELLLIKSLQPNEKAEFFNGFLKVSRIQKIGKNGNAEVDLTPILKLMNK